MPRPDWYCDGVLSGKLVVEKIWENEHVLAFHHPKPTAEVHVVVIPKKHIKSILEPEALNGALLSSMVLTIQKTASKLGLDQKGFCQNKRCNRWRHTSHALAYLRPRNPIKYEHNPKLRPRPSSFHLSNFC